MNIKLVYMIVFYCFVFLCRITDVDKKEKTKPRPQALNTVEMLRVASSGLGNALVLNMNIHGPAETLPIDISELITDIQMCN